MKTPAMRINKLAHLLIAWTFVFSSATLAASSAQTQATNDSFHSISGETISLTNLHGKIVLINFWATSCGICMEEMPDLIATYRQYHKQGLEIISIAMSYDELADVQQYVAKQKLPFPVVLDKNGELARDYDQVNATPTLFVIDKSGQRISKTVGIINFAKLHAYLDSATPINH